MLTQTTTILCNGNTILNETDKNPCPWQYNSSCQRAGNATLKKNKEEGKSVGRAISECLTVLKFEEVTI